MLNINNIKNFFPIFKGKFTSPLTYLDNAATTQQSIFVLKKLEYFSKFHANIYRGVHSLSINTTKQYDIVREKVQHFINAKHVYECIFVKNTTEAINLIAYSYANFFLKKNDEIILSTMEHHSNIVPWQLLCKTIGTKIKIIPMINDGELDLNAYSKLITQNVKLISITYVSNTLGTINDVRKIIKQAHKHSIPVIIDAAQAAAHIKLNVQDLDCDFLVFSAHKMYGPTGVGILYGKEKYLRLMQPYQSGGGMVLSVDFKKTVYKELPYKFEAGTPPIVNIIAFGAAIDFIQAINFQSILEKEKQNTEYLIEKLNCIEGLTIIGKKSNKNRIGIVSFLLKNIHPHDVASMLNESNIAVRSGHHCTQPLLKFYKIESSTRCSLGIYNDKKDIDRLCYALVKIKEIFLKKKNISIYYMNLETLYNQIIFDYSKCIKSKYILKTANYKLKGYNALCGDTFTIYIKTKKSKIIDISFTGSGCTISTASCVLMVALTKGKTYTEFLNIYENLKLVLLKKKNINFSQKELQILSEMKKLTSRIKCVVLPWDILNLLIKKCF